MTDNKVSINHELYAHLLNEELIVVDELYTQKRDEQVKTLGNDDAENSNAVIPNLLNKQLVIVEFNKAGTQLAQFKSFIYKVLSAVNIQPENIDIVELNKMPKMNARTIMAASNAQFVITFGIENKTLSDFNVFNFNGKKVLVADDLSNLVEDKARKLKLWSALKNMYQIT
ncbi:MAG: hypothetical protein KDC92_14325 [Bacteroidetes bacterium]|nr:hypothetical protein [Bacteroidota bacterium]